MAKHKKGISKYRDQRSICVLLGLVWVVQWFANLSVFVQFFISLKDGSKKYLGRSMKSSEKDKKCPTCWLCSEFQNYRFDELLPTNRIYIKYCSKYTLMSYYFCSIEKMTVSYFFSSDFYDNFSGQSSVYCAVQWRYIVPVWWSVRRSMTSNRATEARTHTFSIKEGYRGLGEMIFLHQDLL